MCVRYLCGYKQYIASLHMTFCTIVSPCPCMLKQVDGKRNWAERFYWEVVNCCWDRSYHKSHCSLHLNKKDVTEELYFRKDVPESFSFPHCSYGANCRVLLFLLLCLKEVYSPQRKGDPEQKLQTLLQNHALGYSCLISFPAELYRCIADRRFQQRLTNFKYKVLFIL